VIRPQEFVPFYFLYVMVAVDHLPYWLLTVGALFRMRRIIDLLSYFHRAEVRNGIEGLA
jgi:hypothetical protein